jgi:hypothetical protein
MQANQMSRQNGLSVCPSGLVSSVMGADLLPNSRIFGRGLNLGRTDGRILDFSFGCRTKVVTKFPYNWSPGLRSSFGVSGDAKIL